MRFLDLMDFVAPLVPIGLAAGRLGNFINGELWGRVTDVPWAMVFPQSGSSEPRHPSQLYQFLGEGLVLFAIVWWFSSRPRPTGAVSGAFLIGYGMLRFLAEFAREPDDFLGPGAGTVHHGPAAVRADGGSRHLADHAVPDFFIIPSSRLQCFGSTGVIDRRLPRLSTTMSFSSGDSRICASVNGSTL